MALNLNGVIAALPTPFGYDGEVDHEQLKNNLAHWNRSDVIGYLPLGSTGEFPHLTAEEKIAVLETVRGAMPADKLLLAGTGELSTRHTIEMTRRAADLGADAAVIITPFYYKKILEDEHRAEHYRRIADKAPIPILIYLIPQFAGVYLMPETIAALAEHENIIGLKESSGDLSALRDLFRELNTQEFNVLVGAPMILTEALGEGAAGSILAISCVAPNACVEVDRAWRRGDHEYASRLQQRLANLTRRVTSGGVGHIKAALDLTGLYGFLPRSPLPAPTQAEREEIQKAIEESGFFEKAVDGDTWVERAEFSELAYAD
jgi:4-hydroxy-2-oxoglutarate aldolase